MHTALEMTLLDAWGLTAPDEIIGRVYHQPTPRDEIAALAPLVADAARSGDAVAGSLLVAAGEALGALAIATLRKLDAPPDTTIPLVTDGGFLHACADLLLQPLLHATASHNFDIDHRPATAEAALGALALARDFL
jgi:N-acetylglucosamine kinase-like BadF-type ATPase